MVRTGRSLAAVMGLVVDRLVGEPPARLHPVAWFGRVMRAVERRLWRDGHAAGTVHAAIGLGLGVGAGWALEATAGLVGAISPSVSEPKISEPKISEPKISGPSVSALGPTVAAAWVATAGRALSRAALDVSTALEVGDLARARSLLPGLVGRDPGSMGEKEVARAAVESVAENTVDAVVAPILWAAVAGAPGALGYRAVNTLDAMVGHRSVRYRRYGWASARLDDIAGWVPARITALLVCLVRPAATGPVWRAVRQDAPGHPSPNAGVAEAAFAAGLGLRLGGLNHYGERTELRAGLGDGRPPETQDIAAAVSLSADVGGALGVILGLAGAAAGARVRR